MPEGRTCFKLFGSGSTFGAQN